MWASAAMAVLVAAAEEEAELAGALLEVVEAWVPVMVVDPSVLVAAVTEASVELELELELVAAPELELELPLEQTTSLGRLVTPPRAQIDLATLRVATERTHQPTL